MPQQAWFRDQNKSNKEEITKHMSTLVVVNYDDPYKGEEVRLKLRKLQSEYMLDLEDAVVAVKDEKGKIKLHLVTITGAGAVSGGFWGMLIGLIFLSPLLDSCLQNHRHNWLKICRQQYQAASRRLTMSWMARSAL